MVDEAAVIKIAVDFPPLFRSRNHADALLEAARLIVGFPDHGGEMPRGVGPEEAAALAPIEICIRLGGERPQMSHGFAAFLTDRVGTLLAVPLRQ